VTEQSTSYDNGMRIRREVLGDAHVDAAVANTTPFTAPFQDFITRYAWGDVWARPGLDRRTRSCITLAVLTALHCRDEVGMHVRAALRNGLTPEEIQEVLLHTAVYAGVPAANEAFATARRILTDETAADVAVSAAPEVSSGTQTADNVCPRCGGTGETPGGTCPVCNGTGLVTEIVGDA
jgi:4-carboxymuconolactone decarboxylase